MNCTKCGHELKPGVRFCPSCGTPVDSAGPFPEQTDPRIEALENALGRKYKIIRKIGSGGFAEVYLGEHAQLGREVAIKILIRALAGEDDAIERFRRESKAVAKLSHPNIIDIYDVGESGEIYYFVMKYIPGETLGRRMRREKKILPGESIDIVGQLADALAYAHDHNIIHRDIKPANVMLDEYGKPVLMDFGIARVQFGGQLTRTGTLIGTPHYLPPEQPLGKQVDGRSDIYSLGIMFYEMLAGRVPFHDEAAITLIYKHINEPPPSLHDMAPELPVELCNVVHKMIEKLPENRYQSADELLHALDAFATMYSLRATPSAARRSTPSAKRSTEKLILLAREHLQENKVEKAVEIYKTILLRHPDHPEAKEKAEALLTGMAENVLKQIGEKKFDEARETISRLSRVSPDDHVLSGLRYDLERGEQKHRKDVEFQSHFEAAAVALKHDNATRAVEFLTKALTIDPQNKEANDLLRQARGAYEENRRKAEYANSFAEAEYYFNAKSYEQALSAVKKALELQNDPRAVELEEKINVAIKEKVYREAEQQRISESIDRFCEQLEFAAAEKMLETAAQTFSGLTKSKTPVIQRSSSLYQKYQKAEELLKNEDLAAARTTLEEFLATSPPYDFQVFYRLRKEAEEKLNVVNQRLEAAEKEQQLKKADALLRMGQKQEAVKILEKYKDLPQAQARLKEIEEEESRAQKEREIRKEYLEETASQKRPGTAKHPETAEIPRPTPPPPVSPPRPAPSARSAPPAQQISIPVQRRKRALQIPSYVFIGGGVALVIAAIVAFLFLWNPAPAEKSTTNGNPPQPTILKPKSKPPEIPVAVPLEVSIDAVPWADIEITGGQLKQPVSETTPCRVALPQGRYSVVFKNPEFTSFTEKIDVSETNHNFHFQFKQLDPEKLADSLVK